MLEGFWGIITGAVAAAGGGVGITIWFLKKSSDVMAERLAEKYKFKLNKEFAKFDAYFGIIREISRETLKAYDMIIDISPSSDGVHTINNTFAVIEALRQQLTIARGKVYEVATLQESREFANFVSEAIDILELQLGYIEKADSISIKCQDYILGIKNKFIESFSIYEKQMID